MLNIIHIDTGRELRGGQRQLLRLAQGLRQRGHEQAVVCPEESALELRARAEGFDVFALPAADLGHANGIFQLRQRLLAHPADILHAHDGRGQTVNWLASWGLLVRRIASRRVTFLPGTSIRHRFIYGRTCHAVIAVSQFVRGLLIGVGVPERKIEVIPDGIEIPADLPSQELRAWARAGWDIADGDFVLGQVGAFTPEKGQDVAIEAMCLLAKQLPNAKLLLVGETRGEAPSLIRMDSPDIEERVRFLGPLEDLAPFFAAIDVLVMPSRAEGLGSAALAAMAHGRPVVASRVGGLPEVVEDGVSGWCIPPSSAHRLADAVAAAASNPARLTQFGATARAQARRFSTAIMVERTERLYFSLTGR